MDLSTARGEVFYFFLKSFSETLVHGGATGEDDVLAKFSPEIDVGGLN
jgi:hypothetical protein